LKELIAIFGCVAIGYGSLYCFSTTRLLFDDYVERTEAAREADESQRKIVLQTNDDDGPRLAVK
jgi:hypothetical protein